MTFHRIGKWAVARPLVLALTCMSCVSAATQKDGAAAREASPEDRRSTFLASCESMGVAFEPPAGLVEVPVRQNRDAFYSYALAEPGKFELRVALLPVDREHVEKYEELEGIKARVAAGDPTLTEEEKRLAKTRFMTHPDAASRGMFMATVMNVSQRAPPMGGMDLEAADLTALGADSGRFVTFKGAKSDFIGPFGYLIMLWLHKDDVGDVYVYVLFDDPEVLKTPSARAAGNSVRFTSSG